MCGIAGVIGPVPPAEARVDAALAALGRRGPDASGFRTFAFGDQSLTLIHTRLAIIDLDPRADQPFERRGRVVVFNGEIYNYLELRRELEAEGHAFSTQSDTEVLMSAYAEWGEDCFDRFEGMWTLALFDERDGKLVLSRDRFGEKPLFIWQIGASLFFASEVKALAALAGRKPAADEDHIRRYLVNGYKVLGKTDATFFRNVSEFPAACVGIVPAGSTELRTRPFWQLSPEPRDMTADEAREQSRELLFDAVALRMRADVPIAFCLSGGVDSTVLAGFAAKGLGADIHCFSVIDDDERYDERENIDAMAAFLGCKHFKVQTSTTGFFERMEDLVAYHDAPVATISYYMHSFLSRAISEAGYKVAISGTGADEIYTGYYDHYPMWLAAMFEAGAADFENLVDEWKDGFGRYVQNPLLQNPRCFIDDPGQQGHILLDREMFNGFLVEPIGETWTERALFPSLLRNRMANELLDEVVPVILHEDDLNSMRYSVENRSPYLDRGLVEFLYSVPEAHLIGGGYAKKLLRDAAEGFVPDPVRLDKRKRGFNASILSLVDRKDSRTRERLLADGPIFEIVRRDAVAEFLDADLTSNSFSKFLFSFISAKLFLEHLETWAP